MSKLLTTVSATEARNGLPDLLDRARYRGERIVIEKSGKPAAALIGLEDLELLEALEDAHDLRPLHEAKAENTGFVSLEEYRANREANRSGA